MEREKDRLRPSRPAEERNDLIAGRNAVMEALKAGRAMENIQIVSRREAASGANGGSIGKIIAMARERGIPVKEVNSQKLTELWPWREPSGGGGGLFCTCVQRYFHHAPSGAGAGGTAFSHSRR